jgi:hypothetical protein
MVLSGFSVEKTAFPATKTSAPASNNLDALSKFTPPWTRQKKTLVYK